MGKEAEKQIIERFKEFMKSIPDGRGVRALARKIEVAPSTVSIILKTGEISLAVWSKLLIAYPDLNQEYIMYGRGRLWKTIDDIDIRKLDTAWLLSDMLRKLADHEKRIRSLEYRVRLKK